MKNYFPMLSLNPNTNGDKMDVTDTIMRKYKKVSMIRDKKMRKHRIEHKKFSILIR